MAHDAVIPGTELEDAKNLISIVHDNIDLDPSQLDLEGAFRSGRLHDSAQSYEDAWNDGREGSARLGSASSASARTARPPEGRTITAVTVPHVGQVARVTGTTRVTADVDGNSLVIHTMMLLPAQPEDYLVVTPASLNLPLRHDVHDLFEAITNTFRFG